MIRMIRFGAGALGSLAGTPFTSRLLLSGLLVCTALVSGMPSPAHAQASRTFVSGVGDDVNPCSRTAPCKTFAGAISKTATHGEINVIDAGGFGALTITKSITIDGGESFASILAGNSNGIVINITGANLAGSHVTLRNISIDGVNTGFDGVRILSVDEVYIENLTIFNMRGANGRGIGDIRSTAGSLLVTNTTIHNNTSDGIAISPVGGSVKAALNGVKSFGNAGDGLSIQNGVQTTIIDSEFSNNADGIQVGAVTQTNVDRTMIANNNNGINSTAATATTRVTHSMILNNATNGMTGQNIFGTNPGTNLVEGNGGNQAFAGAFLLK